MWQCQTTNCGYIYDPESWRVFRKVMRSWSLLKTAFFSFPREVMWFTPLEITWENPQAQDRGHRPSRIWRASRRSLTG